MAIRVDPEHNEVRALLDLVDFTSQHVLEIGCGDGRLTWRYAESAAHVTAIDRCAAGILRAREQAPDELRDRVDFHAISCEDFLAASAPEVFDTVLLSWSLCSMKRTAMVPALRGIHRVLKASGRLIDIRPVIEASLIEVHWDGAITFHAPTPAYELEQIQHAEQALAEIIEQGLFALERASVFEFRTYAASVAELWTFRAETSAFEDGARGEQAAAQEQRLAARVEEAMLVAGEGAEVAHCEKAHIARLTPL